MNSVTATASMESFPLIAHHESQHRTILTGSPSSQAAASNMNRNTATSSQAASTMNRTSIEHASPQLTILTSSFDHESHYHPHTMNLTIAPSHALPCPHFKTRLQNTLFVRGAAWLSDVTVCQATSEEQSEKAKRCNDICNESSSV